jgi:hypothetical protein
MLCFYYTLRYHDLFLRCASWRSLAQAAQAREVGQRLEMLDKQLVFVAKTVGAPLVQRVCPRLREYSPLSVSLSPSPLLLLPLATSPPFPFPLALHLFCNLSCPFPSPSPFSSLPLPRHLPSLSPSLSRSLVVITKTLAPLLQWVSLRSGADIGGSSVQTRNHNTASLLAVGSLYGRRLTDFGRGANRAGACCITAIERVILQGRPC